MGERFAPYFVRQSGALAVFAMVGLLPTVGVFGKG